MDRSFQDYLTEFYTRPGSDEMVTGRGPTMYLIYLGMELEHFRDLKLGDSIIHHNICPQVDAVVVTWDDSWLFDSTSVLLSSQMLGLTFDDKTYYPYIYRSHSLDSDEWLNSVEAYRSVTNPSRVLTIYQSNSPIREQLPQYHCYFDHNGRTYETPQHPCFRLVLTYEYECDGSNEILLKSGDCIDDIVDYEIDRLYYRVGDRVVSMAISEAELAFQLIIPEGYHRFYQEESKLEVESVPKIEVIKRIHQLHSPYPEFTTQLIEGIRVLVIMGPRKIGKTTLAHYLLNSYLNSGDDNQIHVADKDEDVYPHWKKCILENYVLGNSGDCRIDQINAILDNCPDTKIIITTNQEIDKNLLADIHTECRIVKLTNRPYLETKTVTYEECSFP